MNKKIENIVFYKFNSGSEDKVKACVFYDDGTVANISYEEAMKEANKIAAEERINGDYDSLLNKKRIFVMSGAELTKRFNEFIVDNTLKNEIDNALDNIVLTEADKEVKIEDKVKPFETKLSPIQYTLVMDSLVPEDVINNESIEEESKDEVLDELYAMNEKDEKVAAAAPVVLEDENKEGVIARAKQYVKKNVLPVTLVASMAIGGIGVGAYALSKVHKEGIMNNATANIEQEVGENGNGDEVVVNYANNEQFNGKTFKELLEVTTNAKQKEVMFNISKALDWFNGEFADAYVEEDKDIRAALTWDEMVALQIAYNDYDKHELHAIFNGAEISSNDLENAYKNATLQLMGAYVIEQEPNLVDLSLFIHNKEGLAFAQKYQNMLEAAKNATGEEKLELIKAFYSELYKDFPITDEVRTEGISHADHRTIESYKLSVAPMVAAAEIMFQNYEIDHTLTDKAIEYFNDLGLCNLAQDKFDKVEMITLACCEYDEENPLYEQFKNAKIIELKNKNIYVIDDEHRDLSQLDRFQDLVNWHFKMVDGHFELETWYRTETYTETKSWKETRTKKWTKTKKTVTDDRDEAVKKAGEKKVKEAEKKVDEEIEKENKKAKEEAEKKAKEKEKELQKEADEHKKDLEEQIKEDEEKLHDNIDDANDKINNGDRVDENDFNDDVHFQPEDKDENGKLDDSVKDITLDGTDAEKDLVDPEVSGKDFDKEGQSIEPEITYDVVEDEEIDRSEPTNEVVEENNNNNNNNSNSDTSYEDLGTPSDNDSNSNNSYEDEYEIVYDDEIDDSEDTKSESKKESSSKAETPKKEEPKAEAPKQESAPKAEPKQEAAPKAETKKESAPAKTNEQIVNDYVEKQASEPKQEEESEKTLVKE